MLIVVPPLVSILKNTKAFRQSVSRQRTNEKTRAPRAGGDRCAVWPVPPASPDVSLARRARAFFFFFLRK